MPRSPIPFVSQYLRRLKARHGDPSMDHELLQRFVAFREEAAFAALVERHAPMVLRVCRSILGNHHDAEDIFQAVFLVLARKAGSIRKGESVGSWLYAVASRLAHKERVRAGKRRTCEQQALVPPEQTPMDDVTWGELRDVLHEEVSRLPEKLRAAVVLCYWEGRTHEQAGQQLGCARGTIKDRLEKARELLRTRLARRGLALPAAWFAASLSEGAPVVSAAVVQTTVRGAMLFSIGQGPQGAVSAAAVACAREMLKGMLMNKLKYGLALILIVGVLSGGAGLAMLREPETTAAPETPAPKAKAQSTPKPEQERDDPHGEPLPPGAVARLGTLRFRHSEFITDIALGTDGTSILSAAGKSVYVWDLATGKERQRFPKHETPVTSFACSPDGKLLASGCQDGTIHVWDAATGRELRHFTAHKGRSADWIGPDGPFSVGFTLDGRRIISAGSDSTIRFWDAASGEKIREFGRFSGMAGVSLSPDGKSLVGVIKNEETWEFRLWEVASGREYKRRPYSGKQILSPTFSPDGKMLAIAVGEKDWNKPADIQLWDADAEKKIRTLRGTQHWVWCRFASDSRTLVSWSNAAEKARLWDVDTGKEIRRINPDSHLPLTRLCFCTDGKTLVSFTQGHRNLNFWDRDSGKEVRSSGDADKSIDFLNFSPDGRLLAAGSCEDWFIRLWNVARRKKVRRFEHGVPFDMQFSSDGSRLASATYTDAPVRIWSDGLVRIWRVADGKELRRIPTNESDNSVNHMAWSGNGNVLATWSVKKRLIRLWNPDTGKQLREWSVGLDQIEALVFSPDGKMLAASGGKDAPGRDRIHVLLWAVDTGRLLHSLEVPINPSPLRDSDHARMAFSPDGRTLAVGARRAEASIYVWELASGCRRLTLQQDEDAACLAFSPNGKLLASAYNLGGYRNYSGEPKSLGFTTPLRQIHLWDLTAEKEIQVLKGHKGAINSLAFSPDGKLLASGSDDTTVLLWDATRFQTTRPAEVPLRPEQTESLWTDLGDKDAIKAYRAIRTLAAAPKASVAFLKRHLHPVVLADAQQVTRLLTDLDSEQFAVREKAMQELEKLGASAATELHKMLADKPSLEVKRRIEILLEKMDGKEHLRMVRALETLERIGTPEARSLCKELASGVADAPLTREARATLRRLER